MFIKKIKISNFRLFAADVGFELDDLNVPNNSDDGSGINLFVGENGCGKTTILDALSMPLLSYKSDSYALDDFNDLERKTLIEIFSQSDFDFDGTMPNKKHKAKGFSFEAHVRTRGNKAYLSSVVVSDQKYIRADGQTQPKDDSPDLRTSVNNPFKGNRFNENDVLFLDRSRTYQIRSGTYSKTRFDRLMEDFDFQYINKGLSDVSGKLQGVLNGVESEFLNKAVDKFKELTGLELSLAYISNLRPHEGAFLSLKKGNNQQITIESLGSGYEMVFSLLYSFFLSEQSKKQLIVLIDEPELHLHPSLQGEFVKILLSLSKTAQIFLSTHSPLFVKQLMLNEKVLIKVIKKSPKVPEVLQPSERVLNYLSANEVNYLAFGLATTEYHSELYNELESRFWDDPNNDYKTLKSNGNYDSKDVRQVIFDNEFFGKKRQEPIDSNFKTCLNKVTCHTYIRNKIHHSSDNGGLPSAEELRGSIEKMRLFFV
ncbi:MAG: AAA family ATPase [Patescibacteria group bacterium]